jgi:hypothetical protein
MKSLATGVHVIQKAIATFPPYIVWQVKPSVWTFDRCQTHGDITLSVGVVDDAVRNRGGMVTLEAWVMYYDVRTSAGGQWISLKKTQTWPTTIFRPPNGQNISMNSTTATAWVAVKSTFWLKKDASNWVPMAQAMTYCSMGGSGVQSGNPAPGPCHG